MAFVYFGLVRSILTAKQKWLWRCLPLWERAFLKAGCLIRRPVAATTDEVATDDDHTASDKHKKQFTVHHGANRHALSEATGVVV